MTEYAVNSQTTGENEIQQTNDDNSENDETAVKKQYKTSAEVYETLEQIADLLEKEQPQSPASTLIKIASAIGNKTFKELLEINMENGTSVMRIISELHELLSSYSNKNNDKNKTNLL